MATKAAPKPEVSLTPSQVLRLQAASAEVAKLEAIFAEPLAAVRAAYRKLSETYRVILEAAGFPDDGSAWAVVDDGDGVRMVRQ